MTRRIRDILAIIYRGVVEQPTGSGWRVPALDGLRGVAALMVLAGHTMGEAEDERFASPVFAFVQRGGVCGVMLFFALSGYLLYLPWLRAEQEGKPPPAFSTYAARRCLRIMPAYYASVVALSILRVAIAGREPVPWWELALHFIFLPSLGHSLLTVYWSLQVEEFFYWALPILHRVRKRIHLTGLLLLATTVSAAWLACGLMYFPESTSRSNWLQQTPFFLPAFALGIATATWWRKPSRWSPNWMVAGAALAYCILSPFAEEVAARDEANTWIAGLAMAPIASLAVLGVARGGAAWLAHPTARFVGGISFSLYLWHQVILRNLPVPAAIAHDFPVRLLIELCLSLPFATVSFFVTERPFLRLRPGGRHENQPAGDVGRAEGT